MNFRLSKEQQGLQEKCRELAADFATRSDRHDRDASHPVENYQRLRDEGFLALSVAREWGGAGAGFFDHTIAYEALGQGCPSTALAFNMHASVVMPLLQSPEVRLPDNAVVYRSEDARSFRHAYLTWLWGSYTAVYLGLAAAAYDELRQVVHARQPDGYAQPLAYHPDVRRHVAEMSVDLETARLITYRSAWLSDTEGPTAETTAALYRAKYIIGEAVTRITRAALTLGGAHGIFKGSRLEQLFRDGALDPPPADYCLYNMGFFELGLDLVDALPPPKPM